MKTTLGYIGVVLLVVGLLFATGAVLHKDAKHRFANPHYAVITVDGCEYITFRAYIVHKENCPNENHN